MSAGQTLNDRILAARHSLAGQGLAKAVCKATTEEVIGPKKKHLDYLLHCTEEPNVSIPTLANLLIERAQSHNWTVVFKSLVTIHHLMCYGNERFVQYLASSNTSFQLSNFLDKSGPQGYDMSPFVRRYAKYLTEKAVAYRTVAFDFCKVKRGKEGGTLRQMNAEKLLKTLPALQNQLDALLEFEATSGDLTNGVINSAFMLLFRDLIRLFACYNDGIINLLEKYFEMNKKLAREALDLYKKFLIKMDRVAEFLKVAENVGVDKAEIIDLTKAPSSLLEALEAHLAGLEGRKVGSPSVVSPTGNGNATEKLAKQFLAEEEQAMANYKEKAKATNPFFSSPSRTSGGEKAATPNILDLFAMPESSTTAGQTQNEAAEPLEQQSGSTDLLQLSGNPFADILNSVPSNQNANQANAGANFFSNILQPQGSGGAMTSANDPFGVDGGVASFGVTEPMTTTTGGPSFSGNRNPIVADKPLVSGDLDASLANLTSNLNLAAGSGKPTSGFGQTKGPPMGVKAAPFSHQPFNNFSHPQQPLMFNAGIYPSK